MLKEFSFVGLMGLVVERMSRVVLTEIKGVMSPMPQKYFIDGTHRSERWRLSTHFHVVSDVPLVLTGKTVVMASVYGPLESRPQREIPDRLRVELTYQPLSGQAGVAQRGREKLIRTACEQALLTQLHPRASVNLTVQEMQDAGGMLAASINAACLALMDSGLSMHHPVAAVSCLVDSEGSISVDPPHRTADSAQLTFAFEGRQRNLVLSHCEGRVTPQKLTEALLLCRQASGAVFEFYRTAVGRKFSKGV